MGVQSFCERLRVPRCSPILRLLTGAIGLEFHHYQDLLRYSSDGELALVKDATPRLAYRLFFWQNQRTIQYNGPSTCLPTNPYEMRLKKYSEG